MICMQKNENIIILKNYANVAAAYLELLEAS